MNLQEIKELIDKVNETEIGELKLELAEFKISIRSKSYIEAAKKNQVSVNQMVPVPSVAQIPQTPQTPQAVPVVSNAPSAENNAPVSDEAPKANENIITIKAPMIGTFYRSSSPDKPPFVKVGDTISKGDTICIIEAMKLFNEIESEVTGKIVKIVADDASPVEYDQAMMLIEPA